MSILNLGNDEQPTSKNRKPLRLIVGVAVLAAVLGLGQTLAAQITLNTGNSVEFGQGVAQTTSCDDSILVTPKSTFNNTAEPIVMTPLSVTSSVNGDYTTFTSSTGVSVGMFVNGAGYDTDTARVTNISYGDIFIDRERAAGHDTDPVTFTNSGDFMLTDITISDIGSECADKIFRIKVYGNTASDPFEIARFDHYASSGADYFADIWWGSGYQPADPGPADTVIPTGYAIIDFINSSWTGRSADAFGSGHPFYPFVITDLTPSGNFSEANAFKYVLPIPIEAKNVYKITVETMDGLVPASYGLPAGSTYYDVYKPSLPVFGMN